ncbi:MAG: hypothetical protein ACUVR8_12065 [Acidobacteriota bacterium]
MMQARQLQVYLPGLRRYVVWGWLLLSSITALSGAVVAERVRRDETAGQPFPTRELGVRQSFSSNSSWPDDIAAADTCALAREFGVTWLHRGRRDGVSFVIYRCPNQERALGLAKLIGGEALADTVLTVAASADEEKRLVVRDLLRDKLTAWQATLPPEETGELPVVVRKLPTSARQPGTEYYAVGALGLARANWLQTQALPTPPGSAFAWANYTAAAPFDRVLVAEYPTPQDATAALEAVWPLASATCLVVRRGNFIVIADGVRDQRRAQAAIERIEYDYVVRWLGTPPPRFSPSSTPQQDIRNIGQLLVSIASFVVLAGFGMILLGTIAGGAFFYWRKQRAGEGFIAADTMLRLNLHESQTLPDVGSASIKHLTD